MKTRWIQLVAGITVFVLCIAVYPTTTNATVVWSDDFDDGNYDGWTLCNNTVINTSSNWSAANYYLQVLQDTGTITHPSNIAYGKWSFDFKANGTQVTTGQGLSIGFISNDINNVTNVVNPQDWLCYGIKIRAVSTIEGKEFRLDLTKWYGGVFTILDNYDSYLSVGGLHHIDVTRTPAGLFQVYYNGSPVLQAEDTEMTTSELFVVSLQDWNMVDNIVVDDDFNFTTTTGGNGWEDGGVIVIGVVIAVAVIVFAIVLLRRK
ncbi:MAG: hypothetical protein ACXACG_18170 [Candidatus Thorarchaeota archaeon]|jgi:hypothetical protein